MITLKSLIIILSFICFLMVAVGIASPKINLLGLGLALFVLAQMI